MITFDAIGSQSSLHATERFPHNIPNMNDAVQLLLPLVVTRLR